MGFSPLTATAAELEANNYPPRAPRSDRREYATWRRYVLRPDATVSGCAHTIQLSGPARSAAAAAQTVNNDHTPNWAGYQTVAGGFTDVQAVWTLPSVHDSGSNNYYSSSWVGLGNGATSDALIQAGSESDWIGSGGGNPFYNVWFEVTPPNSSQAPIYGQPGLRAGDVISVHVRFASQTVTFHVTDETSGFDYDQPFAFSGATSGEAEWIYERTTRNGSLPDLADAPPSFTVAQAANSSEWHEVGSFGQLNDYSMWNCPFTKRLAYASAISGADFHAAYQQAGDNNVCSV